MGLTGRVLANPPYENIYGSKYSVLLRRLMWKYGRFKVKPGFMKSVCMKNTGEVRVSIV